MRSRHLTLIELIVVLTILVALGGIAIGLAPDLLTRTHVAASVTNVTEVTKAFYTYTILNSGRIPSGFDSLVDGTSSSIYSALPGRTEYTALTPSAIDTALGLAGGTSEAAFISAGLTQVYPMNNAIVPPPNGTGSGNATFDVDYGAPVLLDSNPPLATIAPLNINRVFNRDTTGKIYIVFGVGSACTIIGEESSGGLVEPPIHFGDTPNTVSNRAYTRYLAIYSIEADGTEAVIKYVGSCAPHENGLEANSAHLEEWYNANAGN